MRSVFVLSVLFLGMFALFYLFMPAPKEREAEKVALPQTLASPVEENTTELHVEKSTPPKIDKDEHRLFLAPKMHVTSVSLPLKEAQEAKRSLEEERTLLHAFKANANFENAQALAHFYFEHKAYSEVVVWAKEASKYQSNNDQCWILYAKAKFHLGEREEAIRSLELFLRLYDDLSIANEDFLKDN